ncbi:MAG: hypothetical protein U0800_19815 [Isosphaeraceae bacterium]
MVGLVIRNVFSIVVMAGQRRVGLGRAERGLIPRWPTGSTLIVLLAVSLTGGRLLLSAPPAGRPGRPGLVDLVEATGQRHLRAGHPADGGRRPRGTASSATDGCSATPASRFWQQSNALVRAEPICRSSGKPPSRADRSPAQLFYKVVQPVRHHQHRQAYYGEQRSGIRHLQPPRTAERLETRLGKFPFHTFWGPSAGALRWIAQSAAEITENAAVGRSPTPHLDYRYGDPALRLQHTRLKSANWSSSPRSWRPPKLVPGSGSSNTAMWT